MDIVALPLSGDHKIIPFHATNSEEGQAQFSPDSRWVTFTSGESGNFEVYLKSFPHGSATASDFECDYKLATASAAVARFG
jgi:Tol biopolymer transport system component